MKITPQINIPDNAIEYNFIRSPGPGGQNVNKVATGILLRVYLSKIDLPTHVRDRLYEKTKNKMTQSGDLLIKAVRFRSQEQNRKDALQRLQSLIRWASIPVKRRVKTKTPKKVKEKRLAEKKKHGQLKASRLKTVANG